MRGSKLLGQGFAHPKYFHPRPSAAGNGYDATSSGGSNLGPTSQKLNDAIKDRIDTYRKENGENEPVPADAVTASGSGLDPHISLRNAELQTPRVARARGLSEEKVRELIQQRLRQLKDSGLGDHEEIAMSPSLPDKESAFLHALRELEAEARALRETVSRVTKRARG